MHNSASQKKTKFIQIAKIEAEEYIPATELYSNYFNEIDAIYTEL